jgi:signal transduction histidine kinase/DNA-binding response OmpR family regulator
MNFLNSIDKDITLLLDNLPVGIIRFNNVRKCIYANKFVINLFGLKSPYNLENMDTLYMNAIHEDHRENERAVCCNFIKTNMECQTTMQIFNKSLNEYRWMINKRTFIKSEDPNVTDSFMFTLQDVNENKLLEIQLRNETLRAEEAYNHKSIFLANMSHEIRTPLNGIIGMLTLLEDTKLTTDQYDYISMVKECSFNLMTIINDILDYSKLEVGKISLDIKSMNLRECLESTNDIILSKVYEKSLEYTFTIDSNIPEYIYGDTNRIKQILLNLLSNSIKFTDRGSITIRVESISYSDCVRLKDIHCGGDIKQCNYNVINSIKLPETEMEDDNSTYVRVNFNDKLYLRFDITDTGCGIHKSDMIKLFKSFSQVDNHITSKIYQGTGLGLAISRELVELMGGFIWLDWSEIGKGSKFSFILPTIESRDIEKNIHDKSERVLKDANVLIVDDNLHNRISLTGMITKWGMRPHAFSNAEEALHFTRLTKFDIGLIDICMPKTDGPSFASKLREQLEFNNKEFPLVALSSLGDKLASNSKYFKTHLIKPIKESKLKKICIELLQKRIINEEAISSNKKNNIILDKYIIQNDLSELKSNVRILLAEDVYINQKVVVSFLNKIGFENIRVVDNGQQCVDIAKNNDFDIILLDIRMPVMNGEVVLQELNKFYSKYAKHRPYMVAVTAYCLREDRAKYLNMGFNDYIPKPITIDDLSRCLNNFIETVLHN